MNIRKADDIRRLQGGSIDYGYYVSLGKCARNREFRAITSTIMDLSWRPVKIPAVAALIIILNFVPW